MRRVSLCLTVLTVACFKPGGGGESETDEGTTGGTDSETTPTGPTSSISSPTSADPSSDTMSTMSGATMTTEQPTSTTAETTNVTETESGSSSGEIVCDDPEIACGGECVNPTTTVEHCGACNHDCLGGECTEGVCQPVELATGKGRLFMIEPVDDDLYYGGDGVDVGRIGKDGSNDEILSAAGSAIEDREWCYDSTNTGTEVLWGNDWVTAHWAVRGCATPDCAGGPTQYIPDSANIGALVYVPSADRLFWDQDAEIHFMAWPGGADNLFAGSQVSVTAMAYDDEYLYWADRQGAGDIDIRRQNLDGTGGIDTMAFNRTASIDTVAVGEDAIFWAEDGDVVSAPLPNGIGTDDPDVVGTAGGDAFRVIVDDMHVYWVARGAGTGSIQRCPLDGCGGAPEFLAEDVDSPWGLAQDDVAIYWVTEGGVISKIAK